MKRRWIRWALALLVLLALLGGGWRWYNRHRFYPFTRVGIPYPMGRLYHLPQQSLPGASPAPLKPPADFLAQDRPLYDRRMVAWVINDALQRYYAQHGEYPPLLLGGDAEFMLETDRMRLHPNPDPLIAGGFLKQYPCFWPELDQYLCGCHDWPFDWRSSGRYVCMYSTPGDHKLYGAHATRIDPNADDPKRKSVYLDWPPTPPKKRQYALGGRHAPYGAWSNYTFGPGKYIDIVSEMDKVLGTLYPVRPLCFFGYQRGEQFGHGKDEAWLWLYGGNSAAAVTSLKFNKEWEQLLPEEPKDIPVDLLQRTAEMEAALMFYPPRGLDLLNAATGELKPDGIPDGICLLYKLRGGKLVETVADPVLAPTASPTS